MLGINKDETYLQPVFDGIDKCSFIKSEVANILINQIYG
ncbi:MAG: hypothetical protein AVDCRST_MAG95-16 [uncultured Adhaeribacter sp.]|uniref:Uncharacterized protein n=1 Tax=uncultured Adhaeribacter sp. TaxID=448109 RepID=A0A6J4GZM8_9BACT|nr:MAG: hypothetical protein AVDCRST_MAG95-16 [uncultured Adhaeribacter sp.]